MIIDLRTRDLKLPRAHAWTWQHQVHLAFQRIAHRVLRIVLEVAPSPDGRSMARRCSVEVHMADGHVARIEERQRRLGPLLRRAIHRAWEAAARRVVQPAARPTLRLPRTPRSPRHD